MSNLETAATETKKRNENKVMVTMTEEEFNDLQELRSELRRLGAEKKIPSTASVASRVFKQGLALAKAEIQKAVADAKVAKKAKPATA